MYDQFFNSRVVSFNLKGLLFSWHNYSVWMKRFPFLELLFELRLSMIPSRSRWLTTAFTCSQLFTALVVKPGIALVLTWHSVAAPVAPPAPVYCPSKSPNPPYIDPWTCSPMCWGQCCWQFISLLTEFCEGPRWLKCSCVPLSPLIAWHFVPWSCPPVRYMCQLNSDPKTPCGLRRG